jgi:hypothetical protein
MNLTRQKVTKFMLKANAAGDSEKVRQYQEFLDANPDLPAGVDSAEGYAEAIGQGALSGGLWGFDDEIAGLARAIVPGGMGYEQGRDQVRIRKNQLEAQYPKTMLAAELAGGIGTGGLGMKTVGGQIIKRGFKPVAANLGTGAAEGALAGAGIAGDTRVGEGYASPLEVGLTAGALGIGGGVLGGAIPPLMRYGADVGGSVGPTIGRLFKESPTEAAERQIGGYLSKAGHTPETLLQRQAENPAMLLANVDQGTQTLGQRARVASLEGGRIARDALEEQRSGAVPRLEAAIEEAMPGAGDYWATTDRLKNFYKNGAKKLYDDAYLHDIDMTPGMARDWDTDYVQKAVEYAQNRGRNLPGGSDMRTLPNTVNTRFAHDMLRNLKDQSAAAFRRGEGNLGSDIADIHDNMRLEILGQNESFRKAQSIYRGAKETEEALEMGRDVLTGKKYAQDIARERADFSKAEEDAFQTGVMRAMLDKVLDITDTGNTGAKLLKDERVRRLLGEAVEDPQAFLALAEKAGAEQRMAEYASRVLRNSSTPEGLAQRGPIDMPEIPTDTSGVMFAGLRKVFNYLLNRETTPDEWAEMSKILFGKMDPAQVERMLTPLGEKGKVGRAIGQAAPVGALFALGNVALGEEEQ